MRQVPHFLIIGNGRMAQHTCHYLNLLGLSYTKWSRAENTTAQLNALITPATHILVLISDGAIVDFIKTELLPHTDQQLIIHFSGALSTNLAHSAHPLYSFTNELYAKADYGRIPFIIEDQAPDFNTLLPGIPNAHYRIAKEDKAYYHTMCVLSNNITALLWKKFFNEMQTRWQIKPEHLIPYLERTCDNIKSNPDTALTGPIARNDSATLQKNYDALNTDPYQAIMKAVIDNFTQGEN